MNKKLLIATVLSLGIVGGTSLYYFNSADESPVETPVENTGESNSRPAGKDAYFVQNPSNSANLYVKIVHPTTRIEGKLPTVFLIPGSSGDSSEFLKPGKKSAQTLADEGFAVVVFDPDGRGKSEGEEDYDGFVQQDGLKAIIDYVSTLPEIDSEKMGIASYSFGVTMASGALSRYPDLPIKFLSDFEGPANRDDTAGCDGSGLGHLKEVAECDDENFWAQREAVSFISKIKVPYWRIQTLKDHAQPDYHHTVLMINAALSGSSTNVLLNEEEVKTQFSENDLPRMVPDTVDINLMKVLADHINKMLE